MIVSAPHLCTKLTIWSPRYHDKHGAVGEPVVLLSKAKVYHATSTILVEFTQAKSLIGQRFAITRDEAQTYPEETNGKIPVLAIPLSAFHSWETSAEVKATISSFGW